MGRVDLPCCACKGPETEAGASKTFNVFNEKGMSGPVAETGRRAGLDHRDCVWDRALSRDPLEIDFGPGSATGADQAVAWDICMRRAIPVLPERPGIEAARQGVEREDKGFGVCCCLREATLSPCPSGFYLPSDPG